MLGIHCRCLFLLTDVDECISENGGCSHDCVNTHGSFECICPKGFKVQDDEKTCEGKEFI